MPLLGRSRLKRYVAVAIACLFLISADAPLTKLEPTFKAPATVTAADRDVTSLTLSWEQVAGAPAYRVEQSTNPGLTAGSYYTVTAPTAEIPGLSPDTTYYVKVGVVRSDGTAAGPYSAPLEVRTEPRPKVAPVEHPLRVASYNVYCDYCFAGHPNELPWSGRRDAVVSTIKSRMPDVIGLQEASAARLKEDTSVPGVAQFEDLHNGLVAAGAPYELTNTARNNCIDPNTATNCQEQYRGASAGVRILFNTSTVTLLSQGAVKLASGLQSDDRYLAWAILRQQATNKSFFFVNVHLVQHLGDPAYFDLRQKQAQQVVETIQSNNPAGLPVLIAGDLNSNKWAKPTNAPYDVLTQAGFLDPLGNTYRQDLPSAGATAERRIRSNLDSYNGFSRKPPARNNYGNGTYMDYILTSRMRTLEWETVVDVDDQGNFIGVIPSDHNMIRADVLLP
jgi:endonuclease/exonuclease/phosphatase family metal-dependent hydrolase